MIDAAKFTIGTLLTWLGFALILRCAWLIFALIAKSGATEKTLVARSLLSTAVVAGTALASGFVLTRTLISSGESVWRLPLVWWVMPFPAWLAVVAAVAFVVTIVQSQMALSAEESSRKATRSVLWIALAALGFLWYRRDGQNSISVLKGSIPFAPSTALILLLIAIVSIAAMVFTARFASSRRFGRGFASHLALIAGSIIFGTPLVFLLITSFKEDRDMSSPKGIVWVPRVQRTMPYFNPKDPLYETRHQGQVVLATRTSTSSDGSFKLDIEKPLSLRGLEIIKKESELKVVPRNQPLYYVTINGVKATGLDIEDREDGSIKLQILEPESLKGHEAIYAPSQLEPVRDVGLRWKNYSEALSYLPPESANGLVFLKNTLIIAILSCIGTILSSSLAAYAFARMRFPGRDAIFAVFLATMMLPSAVTMLPQFLIYRSLGWIDTLLPLWAPAFFGSALNIFMLRQFFRTIPAELEDAAKIDGCSYGRTFWSVMLPQIKPAIAVIGVTTFLAGWNNFFGPLIYVNSPTKMPISYALQLYMGDRANEPGLMMAFVTMTIIPILLLFFFAQRYFIEGVTLSGLGGK